MRIRTVKPEFWNHPVLSRLSDTARLLAVGLLNLSDDEGYFLADPTLIRNALRPFDEASTITRGALEALEKVGYAEVSEHPEVGAIGRVVNFLKHQRIDRPNASKLKGYFNIETVRTDHGSIPDRSMPEGKGREGERNGTGNVVSASDPAVDKYHKDARTVLHFLNQESKRHFRETDENLGFISARLKEKGVELEGVKKMITRQCERWLSTEQAEYLRPQTLFNATNFDGYYASREQPVIKAAPPTNGQVKPSEFHIWRGGRWVDKRLIGPNLG